MAHWPLKEPLFHFWRPRQDGAELVRDVVPFTRGHAFEGTMVFGATGSGKTSGSGVQLASAMLRDGWGGLVLAAKPDEPERWCRLAEKHGRLDDLILFSDEPGQGFNFLDYELNRAGRGGGNTANAVSVFMQLAEVANASKDRETDVWEKATRRTLRQGLDLFYMAARKPNVRQLYRLVTEEAAADELVAAVRARLDQLSADERMDFDVIERFWTTEWRLMAAEQKSSVNLTLCSVLDPFLTGAGRRLFAEETTLTPEAALAGKIIVVDLPIKEFHETGRFAGVIWKYLFQRTVERRTTDDATRPVFLFADECQFFVTSSDAEFQTTARGARAATVYLTQNLPNLYAELGGAGGKHRVDSLLGNLQTKLFHQNSDAVTNEWAANAIAKVLQTRKSVNTGVSASSDQSRPGGSGGNAGFQTGDSQQEVIDFDLQPRAFLELAKGGGDYSQIVTAILFAGGRTLLDGRVWSQVFFNQKDY